MVVHESCQQHSSRFVCLLKLKWFSTSPVITKLRCVFLGNVNDFKNKLFSWASYGGNSRRLIEDYVGCGNGLFFGICVSACSVISGRSRELQAG
jgi:hypothetical protein